MGKQRHAQTPQDNIDWNLQGNSGSDHPAGNQNEASKLSNYPKSNTGDAIEYPDRIPANQPDEPNIARTIREATDPSKLSDI